MFRPSNISILATLLLVGAVGCGPQERPPELEPREIDHQEVRQAITDSSTTAVDAIGEALAMLESSDLFNLARDEFGGLHTLECYWVDDEMGGREVCEEYDADPLDFSEPSEALLDLLENRIFTDENVESETGTTVVYLLGPDTICVEEDFYENNDYEQCVADVEAIEIRIRAHSLVPNSVNLEILVGPNELLLFELDFAPTRIRGSVDLTTLKASLLFAAETLGESMPEFPEVMNGQISAQLQTNGSSQEFKVSIEQAVAIEDEDFAIHLDITNEAFALRADTALETLGAAIGFNAIGVTAPLSIEDTSPQLPPGSDDGFGPDDGDQADPIVLDMNLSLTALRGAVTLFSGDDRLEIRDVSLGSVTSLVAIDGEEVVAVDLNADHGRSLDADIALVDDDVELSVGPAFDLKLALAFHRVQELLEHTPLFVHDDVLRVTLDGDPSPALQLGEAGLKVLRGKLGFHSQSSSIQREVVAGMCVDHVEPSGNEEPHPFETIGAVACMAP